MGVEGLHHLPPLPQPPVPLLREATIVIIIIAITIVPVAMDIIMTPAWDSFDCDGFDQPWDYKQVLQECLAHPPPAKEGTDWAQDRIDPYGDMEHQVDVRTGMPPPWYAHHPNHGHVLCHPTPLTDQFMDKSLFLPCFGRINFDAKAQKNFESGFPTFVEGSSFFVYYNTLVDHGMNHGVFIPPLQTLWDGCYGGTWMTLLPPAAQQLVQGSLPGILSTCLKKKSTGLISHEVLGPLIQQHRNGYYILNTLCEYMDHPLLQQSWVVAKEPVQ
jgi:hypothetical protein